MKQSQYLILMLICLFAINTSSTTLKSQENKSSESQGYNNFELSKFEPKSSDSAVDIGTSKKQSWICSTEGKILYSGGRIKAMVNKSPKSCKRLDVDKNGYPWIIDNKKKVWQLQLISKTGRYPSLRWIQVRNLCARDVGCSFQSDCAVVDCKGYVRSFNNYKLKRGKLNKNMTNARRIDVGLDMGGLTAYVVDKARNLWRIDALTKKKVLTGVYDVSVSNDNSIYASCKVGTLVKRRSAEKFYQINYEFSRALSVGTRAWFIAKNRHPYSDSSILPSEYGIYYNLLYLTYFLLRFELRKRIWICNTKDKINNECKF